MHQSLLHDPLFAQQMKLDDDNDLFNDFLNNAGPGKHENS